MRARLEAPVEAMLLADLKQDTVDFLPNFNNSQKEPSLLSVRLPILLLNGSSRIAVDGYLGEYCVSKNQ